MGFQRSPSPVIFLRYEPRVASTHRSRTRVRGESIRGAHRRENADTRLVHGAEYAIPKTRLRPPSSVLDASLYDHARWLSAFLWPRRECHACRVLSRRSSQSVGALVRAGLETLAQQRSQRVADGPAAQEEQSRGECLSREVPVDSWRRDRNAPLRYMPVLTDISCLLPSRRGMCYCGIRATQPYR